MAGGERRLAPSSFIYNQKGRLRLPAARLSLNRGLPCLYLTPIRLKISTATVVGGGLAVEPSIFTCTFRQCIGTGREIKEA